MKWLFLIYAIFLLNAETLSQSRNSEPDDAAMLHAAQRMLTDVIIHDIFSPPVASRIYVYANIAAYEVLVRDDSDYTSLSSHLSSAPLIPTAPGKISYPLAAVYSFLLTAKKLVFSESAIEDSLRSLLSIYRQSRIPPAVYNASLDYGKSVSDAVIKWASQDQYNETRKFKRYQYLKQEGKWIPTPPGYMAAVEPYWNRIRTLALSSAGQYQPPAPCVFGSEDSSAFYRQAYEVYETVNQLTPEQRDIANFWDCNPFFLNTEGHLNFATKKISPGAHWISIAGILARQEQAGIMKTSAAYTCVAIAIFDAFISCWDEKFRSNLIRPETYINSYVDEAWRPLLQTPPFPEYPSGHSVVSTAAAVVLARIFGNDMAFTDDTETAFGLPARRFVSVTHAASEAAISRLYGGIHFKEAIENGQAQGEKIGNHVVSQIVDRIHLFPGNRGTVLKKQ